MTQQQSPFLSVKYGWGYGEDNWNDGMDENLVKFSFMFDGNVDEITNTLPVSPTQGYALFNTTDNKFYYFVNSFWYNSPCPKNFVFKNKTTNEFFQFNGTSVIQVNNPVQIDDKLLNLEVSTSLLDSRVEGVELRVDSLEAVTEGIKSAAYEEANYFATKAELDSSVENLTEYTDSLRGYVDGIIVSVTRFGAVGDGITDNTAAFSAAVSFVQSNPLGGVVFIPTGNYLISSGSIISDRSANSTLGRVSFVGADQVGTRIVYTGPGNNCFYIANSHTGSGEPNAAYSIVSNMTIVGPSKRTNSTAVTVNLGAFMKFERLNIQGFDYGIYLQDVDQYLADKITLRFNNKGIFSRKNPTPGSASTQPNNHTYISCTIANNSEYGGVWVGGSEINFFGGDIEYNGTSPDGFGLKFLDTGYEGGRGCNIQGVYFEGNTGIADVILEATTVNTTPLLSVVHQISSSFKRLATSSNSTNNILCSFGDPATVGKQQLVLVGSSFRSYPGYTPSTSKRYISYSLTPASTNNFFDLGSFYESATEKPLFVQNLNKKDIKTTRVTDQVFSNATAAIWLIDSVSGASNWPLWNPTISSGQLIIDEAGSYSVSAFLALSTSTSGLKIANILKNGVVIASSDTSSAVNAITVNVTHRFNVGDIITVQYTQSTGASQSVVGASTAQSNLTVVKLFGQ